MALTSPALTLAVPALFGNVKPVLDAIKKLGPTDFSADAPEFTMKPGATIKVPVSSISAAEVYNASTNNYLKGGTTDWANLTSAHYLQGFDISGVNVDEGCDKNKMEQLFVRRASSGIAFAIQGSVRTALNGVTTSTAITLPASATIADYMALNGAKDWYDFNMCALAVNGAEYSHMKAAFADKKIYADEEICKCIGCKAIVLVPGMTARMVIVPEGSMGFLGRVPTIIANYPEYGVEIDEDSGLAVGIVIADDQATNKRVANADEWFGCYILSSNAASTTAGAIGVGTAV